MKMKYYEESDSDKKRNDEIARSLNIDTGTAANSHKPVGHPDNKRSDPNGSVRDSRGKLHVPNQYVPSPLTVTDPKEIKRIEKEAAEWLKAQQEKEAYEKQQYEHGLDHPFIDPYYGGDNSDYQRKVRQHNQMVSERKAVQQKRTSRLPWYAYLIMLAIGYIFIFVVLPKLVSGW